MPRYSVMAHSRHVHVSSTSCILYMPTKMDTMYLACSLCCLRKLKMRAFQPQDVTLDFEKATHAAAKSVWHQIRIKGCHFHLSQVWYRKIASLGLFDAYKTADSEIGIWLKRFFGGLVFFQLTKFKTASPLISWMMLQPTTDVKPLEVTG